ncbi:hypothetical protein FS837_005150 [Tulasnella sp. UAMH 9824]|nr:hypothetical protein FS837_005150 [Tulasnella sp. UAMH 9824]
MSSIKYPSFIEAPATAIIGKKCFSSLLENLDYTDNDCIKYAVSKVLGLGIVVGGSIVKIPQVLIIQRARSARGLSVSAFTMELISCAISTVYNVRNGYAFSTYGENAFLTLQNAIITLQILHYQPTLTARDSNRPKVLGAGVSMLISFLMLYIAPLPTLTLLQGLTIPISAIAKVPQIVANEKNKSTGTLSAFVVIANIVGCLARVFTTLTEVQDPLVLWGFILSSVLNVVIGVQLWAYWGNTTKGKGDYRLPTEKAKVVSANSVEIHAPKAVRPLDTANLGSPDSGRRTPPAYSPARGSPAPGSGRRWARKVD